MIVHITCRTDRFNQSVVGPEFINECCFGEDFSRWLVADLAARGASAEVICMEDFGWANEATFGGIAYLVWVSSTPEDDSARPNDGEWHVMVERRRSLSEKLLGRNKTSVSDPMVGLIVQALREAGLEAVQIEP